MGKVSTLFREMKGCVCGPPANRLQGSFPWEGKSCINRYGKRELQQTRSHLHTIPN